MSTTIKAAANASVSTASKTSLEIIEAMQVNIETTLEGGNEMKKLISTSTNNIALNATSDVELQKDLKESLKTVSTGKVTPVTERNMVSNQGLSVKADQYVVQNPGKLAKVSMFVAEVLAQADEIKEEKTAVNEDLFTSEKVLAAIKNATRKPSVNESAEKTAKRSKKTVLVTRVVDDVMVDFEQDYTTYTYASLRESTASMVTKISFRNQDGVLKDVQVKKPRTTSVGIQTLIPKLGEEFVEEFGNLAATTNADFILMSAKEGTPRVYSANAMVSLTDEIPETIEGFRFQPTSEYFATIEEQAIREAIEQEKDVDLTPMFFLDEMVTKPVEDSGFYNAAVFTCCGDLTELRESFTTVTKELFSNWYLCSNWEQKTISNRETADIVIMNVDYSGMTGASGATGTQFKGFSASQDIYDYAFHNIALFAKGNRMYGAGKTATLNIETPDLGGGASVALVVYRNQLGKYSNYLNQAHMSVQDVMALKPVYFETLLTKELNTAKEKAAARGIAFDEVSFTIEFFLKTVFKTQTTGLKNMTIMHKEEFVKFTNAPKGYDEVKAALGFVPVVLKDQDPKAEIGLWHFLQPMVREFLAAWALDKTTKFDWAKAQVILTEVLNNEEIDLNSVEKTEVEIFENGVWNKQLVYTQVLPFSFHARKDSRFASGKKVVSTTETTMQGLVTETIVLAKTLKITLEKAVEIVAKNKMISKPKMIKLLAALGMDYLTMTLEKVTEGFKMLVPMNNGYTEHLRSIYATCITTDESEADIIIGQDSFNTANGYRVEGFNVFRFVETAEGSIGMVKTRAKGNLYTTDEMQMILDKDEYLSESAYTKLTPLFQALKTNLLTDTARENEIIKMLEKVRAFPMGADQWIVFDCSSKVWAGVMATEFKQSMIAFLDATTIKGLDINQIMSFERKAFLEVAKDLGAIDFMKISSNFLEIDPKKATKKELERSVERHEKTYTVAKAFLDNVAEVKRTINRPLFELREAFLNKTAKKYICKEIPRAYLTVITHNKDLHTAFVNKKMFNLLMVRGIIAKSETGNWIMVKRYPETLYAGVNLTVAIDDSIADNVICISDVALMLLMGDVDGDMLEVLCPIVAGRNILNDRIDAAASDLRKHYAKNLKFRNSFAKFYKTFGKISNEFGWDGNKIYADYRIGMSLNEGVDSLTGEVVSWETRVTIAMMELGFSLTEIETFKVTVGAYLSQITIAAKNSTKDLLEQFRKNWKQFKNLNDATPEEVVEAIVKAVEYTYMVV